MPHLRRGPDRHNDAIKLLCPSEIQKRADHHPGVAFGAVDGGHGNRQCAEKVGPLVPVAGGGLDQPVPPLLRQFVRSGTGERDAGGDGHGISGVLIDEAKLKLGIGLDEFGVILVVSPRVAQIAKMTPRSLLNGTRGLAQVGRVREGAYGQGGRHGLGVQKAPLLLKFDRKFAREGLTLIERKTGQQQPDCGY